MLRACFIILILVPHVVGDFDRCDANPGSAHQCQGDATTLLQHQGLKMIERTNVVQTPGAMTTQYDDKCLDYSYGGGGNNAVMNKCHEGNNQQWFFDGEHLKVVKDGKCLDWDYGDIFNEMGKNVKVNNCMEVSNQKWYADGHGRLSPRRDMNKCLTYNFNTNNVYVNDCMAGAKHQQWSFKPVDCELSDWTDWSACSATCEDGTKTRSRSVKVAAQHGGKVCDALEDSEDCKIDKACPHQVRTKRDDKCMEYYPGKSDNTNVYMNECHPGDSQKWYFDGEHLKNVQDGKCLDWDYGDIFHAWGDNVKVNNCMEVSNQKWYADGLGRLTPRRDLNKCLTYDFNNNNVYVNSCMAGAKHQQWSLS